MEEDFENNDKPSVDQPEVREDTQQSFDPAVDPGSDSMVCEAESSVCEPESSGAEVLVDRNKVQNRRAAIAVLIMALLSVVLIVSVKIMYYMADKPRVVEPQPTVISDIALETQSVLFDIKEIEPVDPFYVLLIGSDSRKGTALYTGKEGAHAQLDQHSDIMTLLRVDPTNYVITLVSIPRDTQLEDSSQKVCDSLLEGDPEAVVESAEILTGVEIDYYMMIGFTGFEDLVDAMEGVQANVPVDITVTDPKSAKKVSVKAGEDQELNGSESLALARARKEYGDEDQDAYRQINVRNLEISIIQRASIFYTPERISLLLDNFEEYIETNMDSEVIAVLACDFMKNYELITFYSCSGPYEGYENDKGVWVVPQDKEAWEKLMEAVDFGADPTTVFEPLSFDD